MPAPVDRVYQKYVLLQAKGSARHPDGLRGGGRGNGRDDAPAVVDLEAEPVILYAPPVATDKGLFTPREAGADHIELLGGEVDRNFKVTGPSVFIKLTIEVETLLGGKVERHPPAFARGGRRGNPLAGNGDVVADGFRSNDAAVGLFGRTATNA